MDRDSTLKLERNEKTVRWVLSRLREDNAAKPQLQLCTGPSLCTSERV